MIGDSADIAFGRVGKTHAAVLFKCASEIENIRGGAPKGTPNFIVASLLEI